MVRAKFKVDAIEYTNSGTTENPNIKATVKMTPVYGGSNNASEENKRFWQWTPSGDLKLGTINKEAADYFEIGKEYYLDFTKVE